MENCNFKAYIPIILDLDDLNYDSWCELFQTLCIGFGVTHHIEDSNSNDKAIDDPEWNRIDAIIKLWIYGTITQSLLHIVMKSNTTARQVWTNLETLFRDKETILLKNELQNIFIGDSSITDYCTRIKTIADRLSNIDSPVLDTDLVVYTLNGLLPKFQYMVTKIYRKYPLPSFPETCSMLLLEMSIRHRVNLQYKHIIMSPHIFKATIVRDDLQAVDNFQVLGEGCGVVKDLEKGEACDNGRSGVPDDIIIVDPAFVIGMPFSRGLFKDYIGQLEMAQRIKGHESMKDFKKERETKLITILKNRLQLFVGGRTEEFMNWASAEARRLYLSQAPYGVDVLHTIGYIYRRQAERALAKDQLYMFQLLAEWLKDMRHQMTSRIFAASAAYFIKRIRDELKSNNSEAKEEQIMKVVEEKRNDIFIFLRVMNVVDIETTLSRVCQAVLKDPTVSVDELKKRAIGLKKFGKILEGATRAKKQEDA